MKIVTFLRKNGETAKRVVDFPLERDTFRNKIMEIDFLSFSSFFFFFLHVSVFFFFFFFFSGLLEIRFFASIAARFPLTFLFKKSFF